MKEIQARSAFLCHSPFTEKMTVGSGGLTTAISEYLIANHGNVVWGCGFSDDFKSASYMMIDDVGQLSRISGNKYFEVAVPYDEIIETVKSRRVLFIGTPCAAMNLLNRVERQCPQFLDNLTTVTFICNSNVD